MTKGQLKALVKQCLVEILMEGLGDSQSVEESTKRDVSSPRRQVQPTRETQSRRPGLEAVSYGKSAEVKPAVTQAIREVAGDNSVMASIFADTARTTLANQSSVERPGASGRVDQSSLAMVHGDEAARVIASVDPTELFGEASARWADVAFASKAGPKVH